MRILKEAKRITSDEFIKLAQQKFGDKSAKLSLADLSILAAENDVQIPTSIRHNRDIKVDANHWNLSGGKFGNIDSDIARDTGSEVETPADDVGSEYQDMMRLSKAKEISRLATQGKLYLMGRKPKGAFFRIPGVEELTAQLERMLSRELADKGEETMEEQYDVLRDKVKLVAGGESRFVKSLLICGMPSAGKTHVVMETVRQIGLTEGDDYVVKKGRITVASMYRTLIEQINGLVIFDDCDSVVEDKNGINMLKGALDTDIGRRELSYDVRGTINTAALSKKDRDEYVDALSRVLRFKQTQEDAVYFTNFLEKIGILNKLMKKNKIEDTGSSSSDDDDEIPDDFADLPSEKEDVIFDYVRTHLPNKIGFNGRIIFISNMDKDEWDSAILTRTIYQNMNFRSDEMLDFIDKINSKGAFDTTLDAEQRQEVIDYIRELWKTGKLKADINFRLVQQAFDFRLTSQWRKLISQL